VTSMAEDKDETANALWRAAPPRLARLLALGEAPRRPWRREELRAALADQLETAVPRDLGALSEEAARRLRMLAASQGLLSRSLGDLLRHPHPPLELLRLVKEYGKANAGREDSHLPQPVAWVLYYASIAAARLRLNERISRIEDAALAAGLRRFLEEEWLDETTRGIFRSTQALLLGESPTAWR